MTNLGLNVSFAYVGTKNKLALLDKAVEDGVGRLFYSYSTDARGPLLASVWVS